MPIVSREIESSTPLEDGSKMVRAVIEDARGRRPTVTKGMPPGIRETDWLNQIDAEPIFRNLDQDEYQTWVARGNTASTFDFTDRFITSRAAHDQATTTLDEADQEASTAQSERDGSRTRLGSRP